MLFTSLRGNWTEFRRINLWALSRPRNVASWFARNSARASYEERGGRNKLEANDGNGAKVGSSAFSPASGVTGARTIAQAASGCPELCPWLVLPFPEEVFPPPAKGSR